MNTATFSDVLGRHNITVPAHITGAVDAAAWQFGVDTDTYRLLERAT